MYKIATFVNLESVAQVKEAMFEAGAGKIGDYDHCCFETKGFGQFRPLKGANPYIGEENKVEVVEEVKLEMVVADDMIRKVVEALKLAHPYETPAYDVIKLEEL
ncbi:MAG: NGG1p interacting factor NIF3 [Halobacteriovorax sp.]|nr:NGG1p interacting factor NIF3 [Halobacteriovorax sp.]